MADPLQYERYEGGSAEAERLLFERLRADIVRVQQKNQQAAGAGSPARVFHASPVLGLDNARLRFLDSLPAGLSGGFAQPGAAYPVTVRLSSSTGIPRPDAAPDLRGVALRIQAAQDQSHDLLMLNTPASHAADAREFVAFATVMAGVTSTAAVASRFLFALPRAVGWSTANRMRRVLQAATGRKVGSLARETYWSQSPILWADAGPVRYLLRPRDSDTGVPAPRRDRSDPRYLRTELARRLAQEDIVFELCLQLFADEARTPVENASVEWPEDIAPPVPVALLTIERQDIDSEEAQAASRRIEQLAFTPWNTTDMFRPLGNLNRSRKTLYEASSAARLGRRSSV
ncbi:catalase [Streptomyces ochraceiscleroticus]|uniref:Catalase n=1 Tax=Streptomyces ochraceiscleroticus TaxID=47761 RepID=A0ABW1MRX1_9ACTN|nr:catalase [Streptomyces ochraceiscleroticus]